MGYRRASEHQIVADGSHLNGLEILGTLLPATYIPETMVLESQLHQALALIALHPFFTILGEFRHLDVGAGAQLVDGFVGCHTVGGIVSTAGGIIDGLCIVEIELS